MLEQVIGQSMDGLGDAGSSSSASAVNAAVRWSKWVTTNFMVTNDRIIFRQGMVAKSGVEIPLERIRT